MPFAGMTRPCSLVTLLLVLLCAPPPCHGDGASTHNITDLLAASPDFTDFSAALAAANLTGKIDRHGTVTVLAIDNAAMARLKQRALTPDSITRVLSLHVLLDYFGDAKLKALNGTTQAASLFQDSGTAPGGAGMVIVSTATRPGDGSHGVAFSAADAEGHVVFYVKSVKESPYDIAVLQVSDAMDSPSADGKPLAPLAAPAPAPAGAPSPKNQTAPPPQPVAAPSPKNQTAPAPAPKPAVAPSSPKNQTAHPPKPAGGAPAAAPATPADAPDTDDQPPADDGGQHNDGAEGTVAPWSVFAAVAAAVLLLW